MFSHISELPKSVIVDSFDFVLMTATTSIANALHQQVLYRIVVYRILPPHKCEQWEEPAALHILTPLTQARHPTVFLGSAWISWPTSFHHGLIPTPRKPQ